MDKAEALRVASNLIKTYQEQKACAEGQDLNRKGIRYICIYHLYAPTVEELCGLSDYILNNEDISLYNKTFGTMDIDILLRCLNRLNEIWDGWSREVRQYLILGNYNGIRATHDNPNDIFAIFETRGLLKAIIGYIWELRPIFKSLIPQGAQNTTDVTDTHREEWKLPPELATDKAMKIWDRAKQNGLIDDNFKWLKGLQMLACFAREMSLQLDLGKGINKDGSKRINWRIFEMIFELKKGALRGSLNDIRKIEKLPHEFDILNRVFGEVSNPLI